MYEGRFDPINPDNEPDESTYINKGQRQTVSVLQCIKKDYTCETCPLDSYDCVPF